MLKSGLVVSAVCNDCHGTHDILPHTDPKSKINHDEHPHDLRRLPQRRARAVQRERPRQGARQRREAPQRQGRADLHGLPPLAQHRADHRRRLEAAQPRAVRRTATPTGSSTYRETYHGQVTALGYAKVARCSDCHGSHNILPDEDPKSMLAAGANKVKTCRKCHPTANENFTKYQPHGDHKDREKYPILFYVYYAMTGLLFGTFGFFGLHTLLWLIRSLKEKHKAPPLRITEEKMVWRFRPLRALAALHDHRQLPDARDDRHPAEVQLHRRGRRRSPRSSAASRPPATCTG